MSGNNNLLKFKGFSQKIYSILAKAGSVLYLIIPDINVGAILKAVCTRITSN